MDQKCRLNKTEITDIKNRLEDFVLNDKDIDLEGIKYKIQDEITKNLQKLYYEKCEITDERKQWLEKTGHEDSRYIAYHCYHYPEDVKEKYDTDCFIYNSHKPCSSVNSVCINTIDYQFYYYFDNTFSKEKVECFENVYAKYYDDFQKRKEKYNKIMEEMIIVLNSLKTATAVLDKFGFINSINKYINNLLLQQAKPISCMTKAVENSVDNYLSQRKELDEAEK